MASFNKVILVGNLTRDPELRHLPSGTPVVNFRIAVSESFRDRQTNQPREHVCYVDSVAWERQAETCNKYLNKGSPVLVEGRLVYEEWKNQQGESRNRLSVRAIRVQFLSNLGGGQRQKPSSQDSDGDTPPQEESHTPTAPQEMPDEDDTGQDDEPLPF